MAAYGIISALQNSAPVTATFRLWRFDSSLAMVLLLALALGAIIVALVSTPRALRSQWQLSRHRSEITALKAANAELEKKQSALELQNRTESETGA